MTTGDGKCFSWKNEFSDNCNKKKKNKYPFFIISIVNGGLLIQEIYENYDCGGGGGWLSY